MTKDLILLIPAPSEDLNSTELYKMSKIFKRIPLETQNQLFTTCQHPKPLNLSQPSLKLNMKTFHALTLFALLSALAVSSMPVTQSGSIISSINVREEVP
jgi:hypothetical protein